MVSASKGNLGLTSTDSEKVNKRGRGGETGNSLRRGKGGGRKAIFKSWFLLSKINARAELCLQKAIMARLHQTLRKLSSNRRWAVNKRKKGQRGFIGGLQREEKELEFPRHMLQGDGYARNRQGTNERNLTSCLK